MGKRRNLSLTGRESSIVRVISLVLRVGVVFVALHAGRPFAAVVQGQLSAAVRADRKHRNDALELLSFARRTGGCCRVRWQQQELELVTAAAALVLVNGHALFYSWPFHALQAF